MLYDIVNIGELEEPLSEDLSDGLENPLSIRTYLYP